MYPDARTHERALAIPDEGAGRLFDERCIDALARVLGPHRPLAAAV